MKIEFDEQYLRAGVVGAANGVSQSEFDQSRPKAREALESFQAKSENGDYGFPHLPFQDISEISNYASSVRGSYDTVCVVGIGGSALGAWALDCGLRGPHPVQGAFTTAHPRLVILDNVDPSFIAAALASMDPGKTLVVPIAKSGETAETIATFMIVREWLERRLGDGARDRIVAVTGDNDGDLNKLAQTSRPGNGEPLYKTFRIPNNVGGRFSVLSPVGLLPAALLGIDIGKLLSGAAGMTHLSWQPDLEENVALRSALWHWLILTLRKKTIHVAFPYSSRLWGMAFWFRQLWAESLGKERKEGETTVNVGQTPVAALGVTDQHSQVQLYIAGPNDKVFTFWKVDDFGPKGEIPSGEFGLPAFDALAGRSLAELIHAERSATAAALARYKRPNCTVTLGRVDEEHMGAFFQMMEFQTAFMGELLGINAFDQPGVQLGKVFTFGLMGRKGFEQYGTEVKSLQEKWAAVK